MKTINIFGLTFLLFTSKLRYLVVRKPYYLRCKIHMKNKIVLDCSPSIRRLHNHIWKFFKKIAYWFLAKLPSPKFWFSTSEFFRSTISNICCSSCFGFARPAACFHRVWNSLVAVLKKCHILKFITWTFSHGHIFMASSDSHDWLRWYLSWIHHDA